MASEWLIVVDMQNGFINAKSEHVVQPIAALIEQWNASGRRVLATRFHNPEGSQWERLIHWKRLRTSPEIDLAPSIAAALSRSESNVVIDKLSYTSLTDDALKYMNLEAGDTVYLCGIATDGCVLKTAVDLFERGQVPVVLKELVASHAGQAVHEAGLLLLGRYIGSDQILSVADLPTAPQVRQ